MIGEYPTTGSSMLPDAQIDISLCVKKGLLPDAHAKNFDYFVTKDCFLGGIKSATYELHFDIREILGLPPYCELNPRSLTSEQEDVIAKFVIGQFSLLKDLNLDVSINYTVSTHHGFIFVSGDGIKGLTMTKIINTITNKS